MADVLIAGAGPTGLALALWLTRQNVTVRIIDQAAGPGETSRAMVVQARTLELYRQLGLADAVVEAGNPATAMNLWAHGRHRARIDFAAAGAALTPYPFVTVYPQDQHERLLVDALAVRGIAIERNTALLSFVDEGSAITARLRLPDGSEQESSHAYLAGCDGARSVVRHQLGSGFEGGTYKHLFYVADIDADGVLPEEEGHIAFDEGDFALLLPYGKGRQKRLIGTVRDERAGQGETLAFDDVRQDAIRHLGLQVHKVNWFSTYRVHHRLAERFQQGRAFLLGDAAHIHSPAGGQGMNTGILDANNLAWKLAAVLQGRAAPALLESYGEERQAFARKLVATTDRLFSLATSEGKLANILKTHVVPAVASLAFKVDDVRELAFKTVSQITLDYRGCKLSQGKAGEVHGGERMPWLAEADNAPSNAPKLAPIGWQVQVFGVASDALVAWCLAYGVALHVFEWRQEYSHRGLARDALYLLRPDSWVGLADGDASLAALDAYIAERGLRF